MIDTIKRTRQSLFIPAFVAALFVSCAAPMTAMLAERSEAIARKRPKSPECPDCKPANRPFLHLHAAPEVAVAE